MDPRMGKWLGLGTEGACGNLVGLDSNGLTGLSGTNDDMNRHQPNTDEHVAETGMGYSMQEYMVSISKSLVK